MADVKRKHSDGTWNNIGSTPLTTPVEEIVVQGIPEPDPIIAGNTPVLAAVCTSSTTSTTMTELTSITIKKAGIYRFIFGAYIFNEYLAAAFQLYKNGSEISGVAEHTLDGRDNYHMGDIFFDDIACNASDIISLYGRLTRTNDAWPLAGSHLIACIDWNNTF